MVSPNSREGQLESISILSSIPLLWFCISNVGVVFLGGEINFLDFLFSIFHVFFAFHAISKIKKKLNCVKKNSGGGRGCGFFFRKTILSHFMFYAIFNKVVSPNNWNLYPLYFLFPCSDFVSQMWGWFGGGGGVMFFSHFMLFPTFLEKTIWEYKPIISHLMFSSCFFLYAGNIEKCPFTYSYWLNGRWFLQIVDIGHFIMRLEIFKSAPSLTG